jgi:hypothetical protein
MRGSNEGTPDVKYRRNDMTNRLPDCCYASPTDPVAKAFYAAYNAAGERKGLNYQGLPCPTWEELPPDIRVKWEAVAALLHTTCITFTDNVHTINM